MIHDQVRDRIDALRGLGTDDVLAALGLERRRSSVDVVLPAAGLFLAGLMVGAGVALLVAPKSGRETRRELKGKATDLSHRLGTTAQNIAQDVREEVFGEGETKSGKPENGGKGKEAHRSGPVPSR
jgi:hypothetical protein